MLVNEARVIPPYLTFFREDFTIQFIKTEEETSMSSEKETYYYFKDGTNVRLLHYVNNLYAAEKAMLQAYRRSSSDISHKGGRAMPGNAYSTFDGRDFH